MIPILKEIEESKRFICCVNKYNIFSYKGEYYFLDVLEYNINKINKNRFMEIFNKDLLKFCMGENITFPVLDIPNLLKELKGNIIKNDYDDKIIYLKDDLIIVIYCHEDNIDNYFDYFVDNFVIVDLNYLFLEIFSIYEDYQRFIKSIKKGNLI